MGHIILVPVHPISLEFIRELQDPIRRIMQMNVEIEYTDRFQALSGFDVSRHQYNSTRLLGHLTKEFQSGINKIVGVTSVDLFIPVLTFVFGEALLGGQCAIVSTARLTETFYGLNENAPLVHDRTVKEVVHEIGHMLGLVHCEKYSCVMHSSTSVEEIDIKSSSFCEECRTQVLGDH